MKKIIFFLTFILLSFNYSFAGALGIFNVPEESYMYNPTIHYTKNRLDINICPLIQSNSEFTLYKNAHHINSNKDIYSSEIIDVVPPKNQTTPGYMVLKCIYCNKSETVTLTYAKNYLASYLYDPHVHYLYNTLPIDICPYIIGPYPSREHESGSHWVPSESCGSKITKIVLPTRNDTGYMEITCNYKNGYSSCKKTAQVQLTYNISKTFDFVSQNSTTTFQTNNSEITKNPIEIQPEVPSNTSNTYKIIFPEICIEKETFSLGTRFSISGNETYAVIGHSGGNNKALPPPVFNIDFIGFNACKEGSSMVSNSATLQSTNGKWKTNFTIDSLNPDSLKFDSERGLAFAEIKISLDNYPDYVTKKLYFLPLEEHLLNSKTYFRIVSIRDLAWQSEFVDTNGNLKNRILPIPNHDIPMAISSSNNTSVKMGYAVEFELDIPKTINTSALQIEIIPTLAKNNTTKLNWNNVTDLMANKPIDSKFTKLLLTETNTPQNSFLIEKIKNKNSTFDTYRWVYYLPAKITYPNAKESDVIAVNLDINMFLNNTQILNLQQFDNSEWNGNVFLYSMKDSLLDDIYNNAT